jgi:hypothetical protein
MPADDLPEVLADNDGFVNLDFRLVEFEERAGRGHFIHARGRHGNRVLGFAVALGPTWRPQKIEGIDDGFFYWGSGVIKSVGRQSDDFVAVLAELYGARAEARPMRVETAVAVVGLANDPRLMRSEPTRLKLFFESDDDSRYAEVFLNVIVAESRVEFHEKDTGYRIPLLRALIEGVVDQREPS